MAKVCYLIIFQPKGRDPIANWFPNLKDDPIANWIPNLKDHPIANWIPNLKDAIQ